MRRAIITILILVIALLIWYFCKPEKDKNRGKFDPVRIKESPEDPTDSLRYRFDQILVRFKENATPAQREEHRTRLLQYLSNNGIQVNPDSIRRCSSCTDSYMELWNANGIHTTIHGEGLRAGVGGPSNPVGEDSVAKYSLNLLQKLPIDRLNRAYEVSKSNAQAGNFADTVTIAVLDTGIDTTRAVSSRFLWTNALEANGKESADEDGNCYQNDIHGWNFVDGNADFQDNDPALHGSIVTQFIVNEFANSQQNVVQIMALKTHDADGTGDLFSSICAMQYALNKGVNIINASWGFYYYQDNPHPFMENFIKKELQPRGILFVTAAGNSIPELDANAQAEYFKQHGDSLPDALLRNLEIHNFYPACFGAPNSNIIVATTTDGKRVSPTQNYSSKYVDLGVVADSVTDDQMTFQFPFPGFDYYVSGSSYATAIVTGKIGAFLPKREYVSGITKEAVIKQLEGLGGNNGYPVIILTSKELDQQKLVNHGKYSVKSITKGRRIRASVRQ